MLQVEKTEWADNSQAEENVSLENSQHFSLAGCDTQSRKRQDMKMVRSLRLDGVLGKTQ